MNRKGILLAGGSGTRLFPVTRAVSKQLLPLYDKPMIYYPLTVLMQAGVREIAIVTTPQDQALFQRLLGDGSDLGLRLTWIAQPSPDGLAQAYVLAEDFLGGASSVMILGDNIFFGDSLPRLLAAADAKRDGGTVFSYRVADPQRYGVLTFDEEGLPIAIEEKPARATSNQVVPGLYYFDGRAPRLARSIRPSVRGELEITDLINQYLGEGTLSVLPMSGEIAWLDGGTQDSLIEAGEFVRALENRQGRKVGCPEEVAFSRGYIDRARLLKLAHAMEGSSYGAYLAALARDPRDGI